MLVAVENSGSAFTVPPVVVTSEAASDDIEAVAASLVDAATAVLVAAPLGGAASTKAEAGSPAKVCASPAFSAYGALTNRTRGCSSCPCTCTPSQCASPA